MRQIRAGNLHYIGRSGEKDWDWVHDPKNDHGPETLFDLAMEAVAKHQRVREWVGETVLPKAEPEKVVYRMNEGRDRKGNGEVVAVVESLIVVFWGNLSSEPKYFVVWVI